MSTMTKVFVVLTCVLSISLSVLTISFAAQVYNWKDLAETYQRQRDAALVQQQAEQARSQAALALKDQAVGQRDAVIGANQRQIEELNDKFAKARSDATRAENERLAAEAGRTRLQEVVDVQTTEVKFLQGRNETLLSENIDLQSRMARMNSRVVELTTDYTILRDENRSLQERLLAAERQYAGGGSSATSANLVAAPAVAAGRTSSEIRGQVTAVNGDYVSINVGDNAGVTSGMRFVVYRSGSYLADLVVDNVLPREAGGKLEYLTANQVRSGDLVVAGLN